MDMLELIKDDYKVIISQKVSEQQEVKHLIYNEQEYDEFFKDETFLLIKFKKIPLYLSISKFNSYYFI